MENITPNSDPAVLGQAPAAPITPQTSQPQPPTQDGNPTAPTPEQIAQWQQAAQRAQELEARLQQTEQNYGELRKDYTRKSQALAQLSGATQQAAPQDPLAPHIQKLVAKGYSAEDARAVAEVSYEMIQPVMQQQQQYYGALQASQNVGDVMRQAYSQRPELFADPSVASQVEAQLRQNALSGQPTDPALATRLAVLVKDEIDYERSRNPQRSPAPQGQWQPPSFQSFNGPTGGFAPQAPTAPQVNPQIEQLNQQMAAYLRLPKQ